MSVISIGECIELIVQSKIIDLFINTKYKDSGKLIKAEANKNIAAIRG